MKVKKNKVIFPLKIVSIKFKVKISIKPIANAHGSLMKDRGLQTEVIKRNGIGFQIVHFPMGTPKNTT